MRVPDRAEDRIALPEVAGAAGAVLLSSSSNDEEDVRLLLLLEGEDDETDSVTDAGMDPDLRREEGAAGLRSDFVDAAGAAA